MIAAYVALGRKLAGRDVEKGRVLFFAGENPDDVRTRWIKLCEELGQDPDAVDVTFMPFTLALSDEKIRERIDAEAAEHGPFALLIVDTSASYYSGDDENDNVALGNHARMLRTFVELPGGPTVLCSAADRVSALRQRIDQDGEIITVRGVPREHPGLKAELAGRAFIVKTLRALGLDVEPTRSAAGRPGGGPGITWRELGDK